MADNPSPTSVAPRPARSPAAANLVPVSPALQRPAQPRPRPPQPHATPHQTLPPSYTRTGDAPVVPVPSHNAASSGSSNAHGRPPVMQQRSNTGKESLHHPGSGNNPPQRPLQPLQSPQPLSSLSSPSPLLQRPPTHNPQQSATVTNPSSKPQSTHRPPLNTGADSSSGSGQPGYSPGVVPIKGSPPMVSPSTPLSPLPPSLSGASPLPSSAPKGRTLVPPTLPPARAHGIHARALARPTSAAQSALPPDNASAGRPKENSPTKPALGSSVASSHQVPQSPGARESIYPPSTLQAPQQAHQPRQRQPTTHRPPVDALPHARSQPSTNVRQPSSLSLPITLPSNLNDALQTPNSTHISTSKASGPVMAAANKDDDQLEQDESDDAEEENESAKGVGNEKARRSRHRKVRRSLEKLTRISTERKRRSRQLKAMSTISPPKSPMTGHLATKPDPPKRQSLWASIFGNGNQGRAESRPSVADALVKSNGSTQSLGSHSVDKQDSQQPSFSSTLSSPTSPRSDKSFTDSTASVSVLDSESVETEPLDSQSIQEDPEEDAEASKTASAMDDISTVNVAPHDRSRTLPGIWDSNILWSLSRVLSAKKVDPPLESDSSDSDSSEETQAEDFHNAEESPVEIPQKEPSVPPRAALSVRTNISKERVIVAESQVQIGDGLDDEDPFTDSHAWPSTSPSAATTWSSSKGLSSGSGSSSSSSPSPSLSPLSYITGSSPSGTWSLQGSRQSLMKMIFKSKNDASPSSTSSTPGTPSLTSRSNISAEQNNSNIETRQETQDPSTPVHTPHPDLFSDFESTGLLEHSLEPLSKELKRRSFILPGAFPGQETPLVDDSVEAESETRVDHIPMYAAAEGDSLAAAHEPILDQDQDPDVSLGDYYDQDGEDETSSDLEPISTVPIKASSYERPSFLAESPLPRFNTAALSAPGRHTRTVSQPLTSPVTQEDSSSLSRKLGDTEMLQIEVHRVTPSVNMRQYSGVSNGKTKSETRPHQGKTSPSVLAVATALSSTVDAKESVVSPITPPLKVSTTTNFAMSGIAKAHGKGRSNSSEAWSAPINNTIDYSRYKEEVYDSDNVRPDPFKNTSSKTVAVSNVSGYQSGNSRTGTPSRYHREDSTSPDQAASSTRILDGSQGTSSTAESDDSQYQQSKLKTVPPPLPPPRNSRRPRSKTLSRYSFHETTIQTVERAHTTGSTRPVGDAEVAHSRSSNASPFHAAPPTTTVTLSTSSAYESPAREYIMEEMGSEQARTFNEEDYIYCQNDKSRHSIHGGSNHGVRSQSSSGSLGHGNTGQAYGPGNSAFDPHPEWTDYSQQPVLQQQHQRSQPNSAEIMSSSQWQHVAHSAVASSNEASLVAALRDQIASLSSERDQFYQEAMLLRQKHEMLTSIVNTMGVAVESIQAQQQQQQVQQQQQHQQQQIQMSQQMQHQGHAEYGPQTSSQEPPHVQPRRHHEDYPNNRYHNQASIDLQMNGFEGSDPTAAYQREQFELQQQQQQQQQQQSLEEPQLQPRRNHFHDIDHQSARVRQLSDEFSIQMPRNSEESMRSYGGGGGLQDHYQDPSLTMSSMQPTYPGPMGGTSGNMVETSFMGDNSFLGDTSFQGESSFHGMYDAPQSMDLQNIQQQQQVAQMQHPPQPLSFEEGYDLIATETAPVEPMNEIGGYYQQQQQQQQEEDQMRGGGLTLQELKLLHGQSGGGYAQQRGSSDSRFSGSQASQDAYQLVDVVTTRPMSGSSLRQQLDPRPDLGYGQDPSGYGNFQSQAMLKDQHLEQLRPRSSYEQLGSGSNSLRRHHSMNQPLAPQQFQSQQGFQPQQHQPQQHFPPVPQLPPSMAPPPQRLHQPRPPPWAPQHLKRSSSSSMMTHRRMPSNPQDIPPLPSQGLLLLSSSTSFMGESPMLSSLALESSVGAGSMAPLSLLSNVVQREKVRIEGKTSSKYGAAGWSERPFSPVLANGSNDEVEAHVPSFASAMMNKDSSSSSAANSHLPPPVPPSRIVSKDEANKIRQQFDSYLADPKRRSRHLEMEAEEDRRLKEREQERERGRERIAQEDAARLQSLIQKQKSVEIMDIDSDTSVDSDEEEYPRNRNTSGAAYTSMATSAPDSSSGWDQYQQLLLQADKDKREKEEVIVETEKEEVVPPTSDPFTSNRIDSVDPEFEVGAMTEATNASTGLLGRSKTIASTGISSRAVKENSFRAQPPPPPSSGQPQAAQQHSSSSSTSSSSSSQTKSSNPFLNAANVSSSTPLQQQSQLPSKEKLLRQQSSSGSLRSVARHSEQHRGPAAATAADEQSTATNRLGTKATASGMSHSSPAPVPPKTAAVPLANPRPAPTPAAAMSAVAPATNGQRAALPLPPATLPRPPVSTFKPPVAAPPAPPTQDRSPAVTLVAQTPHFGSSSSQSTSTPVFSSVLASTQQALSSSTSNTVVDEEGGDWGLQANPPRRYHSVKLGMGSMAGGVTGATRRVIGRPVERGHGIERGPEDCV